MTGVTNQLGTTAGDAGKTNLSNEKIGRPTSDARSVAQVYVTGIHGSDITKEILDKVKDLRESINIPEMVAVTGEHFIQSEKVARSLLLSLAGGQESILYGPPGYGKSDIVRFLLQKLDLYKYTKFVDFGSNTTEADLYGGLDLKALAEDNEIRFLTDDSWMKFPIVVFEEALDGTSPKVLQSLRSCLTSGKFVKNKETELIQTQVVIILTNKSPSEFAGESEGANAFISRFPIQRHTVWDTHTAEDYNELFSRRFPEVSEESRSILSEVVAYLSVENQRGPSSEPVPIAPREAIQLLELILSGLPKDRKINGNILLAPEDLYVLDDLPRICPDAQIAIDSFADKSEEININKTKEIISDHLTGLTETAKDLQTLANLPNFTAKLTQLGGLLDQIQASLNEVQNEDRRKTMEQFIDDCRSQFIELNGLIATPPTVTASS